MAVEGGQAAGSGLVAGEDWQACRRIAEDLVRNHMAQYDPSHDWAHVNRVRHASLRIARSLAPREVDLRVVELAALFHDVADSKYTSDPSSSLLTTLHPFLSHPATRSALSPAQVDLVLRIVPSVSWSTEKRLRAVGSSGPDGWSEWHDTCLELHAVQDADRLDAVGAIGIMRCAAFSAIKGRGLLESPGSETIGGVVGESAEAHFEDKLFRIRDRMKTWFGKQEAERRHQTMKVWMQALQEEKLISQPAPA